MIPVVINNRNRVTSLNLLVDWLMDCNARIIILDNNSKYPPLLQYYRKITGIKKIEIVYLGKNMGHRALYTWGKHFTFPERYFVYTDSDVVPSPDCPKDLLKYLVDAKKKYPEVKKIGMCLEINDLPDCYNLKQQVRDWEAKFWQNKRDDLWIADVDTTFAIYDNQQTQQHITTNCLRTDYPYVARHLPWYIDVNNLSEEERYYLTHSTTTTDWTLKQQHALKMSVTPTAVRANPTVQRRTINSKRILRRKR